MKSLTKTPRIILVSLLVAIALLSTISVALALNGYNTITVDSDGDVGLYTSLALNNDKPVISYYDTTNDDLKLAICNDATCSSPTLTTVDSTGDVGQYTSLALAGSGYPVISYFDDTNDDLKVVACSGLDCSTFDTRVIDTGSVGQYTSLALNSSGYPRISYFAGDALKVAACNGSIVRCARRLAWTLTTVDSGGVGVYSSLALNSSGNAVISYYDQTNTALKVAVCNDAACSSPTLTTVDSTGEVGEYTSLALNNDKPVISYYDATNDALKVAVCNDATCSSPTLTTVDNTGSVGQYTSLALNSNGYPVISYYDDTNDDLKVATCNDATCTSKTLTTVDSAGFVGTFTSLALNSSSYPVISYNDATNKDLKVAVLDTTIPTVTIEEGSTQPDPTNTSPISFDVKFSESVTGFDQSDINISGMAFTPIVKVTGSGDTYTVTVSRIMSGETITATIPADAAQDNAGNKSLASTSLDNRVTYTGQNLPEIDVQRPSATSIADGGTDALANQTVGTVNLTYTVDNSAGTAQLDVTGVSATNYTNSSGFSSSTTFPLNIAAGDTGTIDIYFDIDAAGAFSFDMDIASNDADEATYDIKVSGTRIGVPEIDVQRPAATSIADGGTDTLANQSVGTVNLTYTIDNSAGTDQLTVTGVSADNYSNSSGFNSTTTFPLNIAAGDTDTIDISFDIDAVGAFSFDMDIASNDADEATYDIKVSSMGVTPEIDVQRPATTSIADGGTDTLANQSVGTVNLTYTIDNSAGTDQLTVTGVSADNYSNSSGFNSSSTFPLNIAAGDTDTIDISFDIDALGAFSFYMDIASNDADEATYDIAVEGMGVDAPVVTFGVNTVPANNASLSTGPSEILVEFSEDMEDDGGENAANNTANYVLVEVGTNGTFDTTACDNSPLPGGDDTEITINSATYDGSDPFVTTLGINGGTALPAGDYRLFVCGTTSVYSAAGVVLNGSADVDSTLSFSVQAAANTGGANNTASALPATGFAMGEVTTLPYQPAAKAYESTAMTLDIPKLGVSMPIVGVPQSGSEWDVTWLGNSAGYLYGSAFPTWAGNTVITGHVWDAYNQPGAFAEIKTLKYGDQIEIQAWGQTYTYEVRESRLVTKKNTNVVFQSEQYDWVTLVTCEFYNPFSGEYLFRRAVRAVLVSVK
jgi:LPXTG-site transpeptidase (sortase) family protein